jgi:hypothetical protein
MQEDLTGVASELRKEACPQRVIDAALRRIAAETPPRKALRYAIPVALAGAALVFGLLVQRRPAEQRSHAPTQAAIEMARALDLFGTVLIEAGARSETIISDRAMPPLRLGFDTATNTIIRHTKL